MTYIGPVGTGASNSEEAPVPATDQASGLAALLKRAGRGDKDAFAELYDATSARVFGLAVRVVRDPAQAEEVAQESYLELWRGSARFDPDRGSAIAWILTIVHRKAVDRVRSAEASSRRDTSYHQKNQTVEHDTTAEAAHASMEAHRVRGALPASPTCSEKPSSSPTSVATRTPKWRPCSTFRSAPPRPAFETA